MAESYAMDARFERALVVALCERPRLFERIGQDLDPTMLVERVHQLILEAARSVAKEVGRGPSDCLVVVQRIRRAVESGRVSGEDYEAAVQALLDPPELTDEELLAEALPLVRRKLEADIARAALDEFSQRGDYRSVEKLLRKRSTLGVSSSLLGTRLSRTTLDEIGRMQHLDKLPTGVMDLDLGLSGGLVRGALGVYMAPSGHGKSMFLVHQSASALRSGLTVCYATLELPEEEITARIIANLTNTPTNIVKDPAMEPEVGAAFDRVQGLGLFVTKKFPPGSTTPLQVIDWVEELEQSEGAVCDLLVVDYAEKMISHRKQDQDDSNKSSEVIHETLRLHVETRKRWGWTAAQVQRRKGQDRKRKIEGEDVAGFIGKVNVADLVVSGHLDDTGELVEVFVVKNRYGKQFFGLGPYPTGYDCGRFVTC